MKNLLIKTSVALALAVPAISFAADGAASSTPTDLDLSSLTNSISFGGVSTAVLSIAGTIAAVYAVIAGAKLILKMIRAL